MQFFHSSKNWRTAEKGRRERERKREREREREREIILFVAISLIAMAPHVSEYVSFGGLVGVGIGWGCYFFSNRSGRKASELDKVPKLQSLSDLKGLPGEYPKLASVSGRVCSEIPLKCENVPDLGVIHRSITKEVFMKKTDRGDWKRDNSTITDFTRETQWHLGDASSTKLQVRDGKTATGLQLKTVFVGFEADGNEDSLTKLLKAGADLWQGVKKIGTEKTEGILPLGTTVTAVGEISKVTTSSKWASDFVLQRPLKGPFYITTQSMPELVQSLSRSSKRWWYLGLGFTCIGSYFIVRKLVNKIMQSARLRQFKKNLQDHWAQNEAEGSDAPPANLEKMCIACMEKTYDSIFIDCGHMCCCYSCGSRLKKCPICRVETKCRRVYSA